MKKVTAIVMIILAVLSLSACSADGNKAEITVGQGEMMLSGKVTKVSGNSLLLECEDSNICDKFHLYYDSEVVVVEDGYYVVDLAADYFENKEISVICSNLVQETYPAGLTQVRMIIIN